MNPDIRTRAKEMDIPLIEFILRRIDEIEKTDGKKRTIFAACPNSISVIRAALQAARRWNSPLKFAATLNQVDTDRGYTGLTQEEFAGIIRLEARKINLHVPVIIAVDHGGPWLKDKHTTEHWEFGRTFDWVKRSFESAIAAGYDLIHVDPTVDINIPKDKQIPVELVVKRTIELIDHAEKFRRSHKYSRIAYEVGTEEVHGGLADIQTFRNFLELLRKGLKNAGLEDAWPCFVVGKVGTDLHTTTFDPETARKLTAIAREYGSVIKGHYTDDVTNPGDYPLSGMGAANVGPEFTGMEYDGLLELEGIEETVMGKGEKAGISNIGESLRKAVINSGRWKKWLQPGEDISRFGSITPERQAWLIRTGCRYIWQNREVTDARRQLYENLESRGIKADHIVLSKIESAMDKYFEAFNLKDLNTLL
jgi:tagatose-1,6-bisphosphate aldolase non-catalytic subunit AgaZ/GatZ